MLKQSFGTDTHGNEAQLYTLENANGTQLKVTTLGASIVSFIFKDKNNIMRDVILGYDKAEGYIEQKGYYFGATVGRNANRICGAKLTIGGVEYALEANSETNNLHSGSNGVSHKILDVESVDEEKNSIAMKITSKDLEQGFPGNMQIKVTFTLTEEDGVRIDYEAVSDKDTVANFTNHSYFNLAGHDGGYVGSQKLKIYADAFTPVTPTGSIPTGELRPVAGTPFDFTQFKEIGKEINDSYDQLVYTKGYDHNFVLHNGGKLELMAEAVCEATGIHLYAYTDRPGVQLYAGNFIEDHEGKGGARYNERHGFCLEAQCFPDAVNNPAFETPLLKAGEVYTAATMYKLALD